MKSLAVGVCPMKTFFEWDNKMLSIIVPIYNIEEYLIKCIESILNQQYRNLEILLVDDGSTDGCPKICDEFEKLDSRIKVLHKKNEGLVRARKAGLENAKGDYVTFVDGDDWIEPDMYSELMEIIVNTGSDFIDSDYFCKEEKIDVTKRMNKSIYNLNKLAKHRFFLTLLGIDDFLSISPSIWSKIFKAEIIKSTYKKVPDNMQYGEDVINLLYCILEANKVTQVNKAFYHYNYRRDSLSHLKSYSFIRKEAALWNYCANVILDNDDLMNSKYTDAFLYKKLFNAFTSLVDDKVNVIQYYYFPCVEKLYDKRVVIYGAGNVGKDYLTQISKYERCKIVCWVDKNYKKFDYKYRKVVSVDDILKIDFEIVLIAILDKKVADEIKNSLIKKGISKNKILWYKPSYINECLKL